MKLSILPSECSCEKCSFMCHSSCCGIPSEMELLILSGYGDRLMLDDLPGGETMLKPALKGYEGKQSPWETSSREGCTFWHDGKCQLHMFGLKPAQGKLSHHNLSHDQNKEVGDFVNDSWKDGKGDEVIEKWKEINRKGDIHEDRNI
jgi:hypothetical protein